MTLLFADILTVHFDWMYYSCIKME